GSGRNPSGAGAAVSGGTVPIRALSTMRGPVGRKGGSGRREAAGGGAPGAPAPPRGGTGGGVTPPPRCCMLGTAPLLSRGGAVGLPGRIERTVELAHPPGAVWAALTTAHQKAYDGNTEGLGQGTG